MSLARLRFYAQGRPVDAQKFAEQLAIYQASLPEGHQAFAEVNAMLAWFAAAQERWNEAGAKFDLSRRTMRQYVDRVLPALPEADQLIFFERTMKPPFIRRCLS